MKTGFDTLDLIKKARDGEKDAEEQIIKVNLGLVHSAARRFMHAPFEYDDLFQAGCIGLLKASRGFDFSKGVMFSTYAFPVIAGEIKRYIRDDGPIKVGRHLKEIALRTGRARDRLTNTLGREPALSEISEATGDAAEDIIMALDAVAFHLSLDEPAGEDGSETTLSDFIGEDKSESITEIIALKEGISNLPALERQIIGLRFLKGKTQQETAEILNMTQVQISRKEKKIIEQLKEAVQ